MRDIFGDSALEEHWLLAYVAELRAQPAHVHRLDVDTVEQHHAGDRIVEALDKIDGRRFASTRRAAERNRLAGGDDERVALAHEVVQRRRVCEGDVAQLDGALHLGLFAGRRIQVVDGRNTVDELK